MKSDIISNMNIYLVMVLLFRRCMVVVMIKPLIDLKEKPCDIGLLLVFSKICILFTLSIFHVNNARTDRESLMRKKCLLPK